MNELYFICSLITFVFRKVQQQKMMKKKSYFFRNQSVSINLINLSACSTDFTFCRSINSGVVRVP